MYSDSKFQEINERLEMRSRDFSGAGPHDRKAQTLLISSVELNNIHKRRENDYPDVLGAEHQYQIILSLRAARAMSAVYSLVKHYQYDSAYRDLRFLYETYCMIRGLNKNKDRARELSLDFKQKAQRKDKYSKTDEDNPEPIERLFKLMREEKKRVEEVDEGMNEVFGYLSNRSIHPVLLHGVSLDDSYKQKEEETLLTFSLYFGFGLAKEVTRTYEDTPAKQTVCEQCEPIHTELYDVLSGELPSFLFEEYDL